jgi:hypothetical protein
MSGDRRGLFALSLLLTAAMPLHAQGIRRELGAQLFVLSGDEPLLGAAGYAAIRPTSRARLSLSLGAGGRDGQVTGRGELLGHFLLSSGRRTGPGVYAAGGLAVDVASGSNAWLVGALGVEGAPGGRSGWMAEIGVGGGWRGVAGWRWRWT